MQRNGTLASSDKHMFRAAFISSFCIMHQEKKGKKSTLWFIQSEFWCGRFMCWKCRDKVCYQVWHMADLLTLASQWFEYICADWTNAIKLKAWRSCRWHDVDIRSQLKMELTWFSVTSLTTDNQTRVQTSVLSLHATQIQFTMTYIWQESNICCIQHFLMKYPAASIGFFFSTNVTTVDKLHNGVYRFTVSPCQW